jgi:hypothetical protein
MLVIDRKPTFTAQVTARVPAGDAFDEETFSASFLALDAEEIAEYDFGDGEQVRAFLGKVTLDMGELVDAAGAPVTATPELIATLIKRAWLSSALLKAYFEAFERGLRGN